jgi:N-acetylglutamate synthase-like GNAT family acetyltransferase
VDNNYEIIDVSLSNVAKTGFFCYMSKPKAPGYLQKREWLEKRFAEGLKIKILHENGGRDTGFVEYIPGEYAWRAVYAPDMLVIHCLWVVGKGKGKGYGSRLVEACLDDARRQGKQGVVMVSSDRTWLAGKELFLQHGFVQVDQAPPAFQLLVHRFEAGPDPVFPGDWEQRCAAFGPGLTVVRTPQCPYVENGSAGFRELAREKGIPFQVVEFRSAREVQERAPTAYGIFNVIYHGSVFSYTYMTREDFEKRLAGG